MHWIAAVDSITMDQRWETDTFERATMTEEQKNQPNDNTQGDLGRRDFVALSVAAGVAASASSAVAAGLDLVETDVEIKTPDGTCDAAFIRPKTGSYAGVIIWPDAFGLRPSMRDMAKRIAAEGYSVLVPNPFYRVSKAPQYPDASGVNFATERAKLGPLMGSVNAAGAAEKDAIAYVAFLDNQKEVNKSKKIGTQGYCMGGPLVVRTCAAVPDRMGAGGSFHGGGLVSNQPTSPHLLAPKIKAQMYFGIASNDDKSQPDAKDKLKEAFPSAGVEVYGSLHGWCVPDMPPGPAGPIYNKADAETAWGHLVALYKAGLA
jgi:carboxymethylenebutenolidase